MGSPLETLESLQDTDCELVQLPNFELLGSDLLASGFREYNSGLDVPSIYQDTLDEILEAQALEICPTLADHQRRVGGYAGTILPIIYPEYDDSFHIGLIRIAGALHDIGKKEIERTVVYRSLGIDGFGAFDRTRDMPEMKKHTFYGYKILGSLGGFVPPEAAFIAGLHHRFPNVGQEGYGLELSEVDRILSNNPGMDNWVNCGAKVVAMCDYFDATSRVNGYFKSDEERDTALIKYMRHHQPDNYAEILGVLHAEKLNYIVSTGKIALAA